MKLNISNRHYQLSLGKSWDLSIPITTATAQPSFFGCDKASSEPLRVGNFTGNTRAGGSCNVSTLHITPHCNGTHTECAGHISRSPMAIGAIEIPLFLKARLTTVKPVRARQSSDTLSASSKENDWVIDHSALTKLELTKQKAEALIIRTLPNPGTKRRRNYTDSLSYPYLTEQAARYLSHSPLQHLLIDTPSLDRADDGGLLVNHSIWWQASSSRKRIGRRDRTVTEFIYVPDDARDGWYALNLQIAPLPGDAAPSRPTLYRLRRRNS